jgi:hypothetical protein
MGRFQCLLFQKHLCDTSAHKLHVSEPETKGLLKTQNATELKTPIKHKLHDAASEFLVMNLTPRAVGIRRRIEEAGVHAMWLSGLTRPKCVESTTA